MNQDRCAVLMSLIWSFAYDMVNQGDTKMAPRMIMTITEKCFFKLAGERKDELSELKHEVWDALAQKYDGLPDVVANLPEMIEELYFAKKTELDAAANVCIKKGAYQLERWVDSLAMKNGTACREVIANSRRVASEYVEMLNKRLYEIKKGAA